MSQQQFAVQFPRCVGFGILLPMGISKPDSNDKPEVVNAVEWRRHVPTLLGAAGIPLLALLVLYGQDVPLGKPDMHVERYSPLVANRLIRFLPLVAVAAILSTAVWSCSDNRRHLRVIGSAMAVAGCVGVGIWSFVAPPHFLMQHMFNFRSPPTDGAFMLEADEVQSVSDYLSRYPQRATTSLEEMRGARVLSNTPGTTILAYGCRSLYQKSPAIRGWVRGLAAGQEEADFVQQMLGETLLFGLALTLFWVMSVFVWFGVARLWLPLPSAWAVAVCCLVTPMTLMFTPGKDPAQLLTLGVGVLCWFRSVERGSVVWGILSGGVFVVACMIGLIHIWLGAIVFAASAWRVLRTNCAWKRFALRSVLPLLAGVLGCSLMLYGLLDCNVWACARAAAKGQTTMTRGPESMPWNWQLVGAPLFLLFAGTAWWWAALNWRRLAEGDGPAQLGRGLIAGALAVMLSTLVFTNIETVRLWIPFVPLMTLGIALCWPMIRKPNGRAAALLATLVFLQVVSAGLQWSLMDAREAEMRLGLDNDSKSDSPRYFE